jgi:hypothetical protein
MYIYIYIYVFIQYTEFVGVKSADELKKIRARWTPTARGIQTKFVRWVKLVFGSEW